ncbi:MAG: hypothetical protein WDN10_04345 [bacterium]
MPPTIPTSFVPKQPVRSGSSRPTGFNLQGLFLLVSLVLLGLSLAASAGVFAYGRYLEGQASAKSEELARARASTSESTVEEFLRLRNRLSASEGLLDRHVTLSSFFSLFESLTIERVRFTALNLAVKDDQTAMLQANGQAANFNALAAESHEFSGSPHVKNAIFGNFTNEKNGAVNFALTATILPGAIAAFSAASFAAPVQETPVAATSTASTTPRAATTTSL